MRQFSGFIIRIQIFAIGIEGRGIKFDRRVAYYGTKVSKILNLELVLRKIKIKNENSNLKSFFLLDSNR